MPAMIKKMPVKIESDLSATRAGLESPLCISLRICVALSSTEGPVGVAIASDAMVGICRQERVPRERAARHAPGGRGAELSGRFVCILTQVKDISKGHELHFTRSRPKAAL